MKPFAESVIAFLPIKRPIPWRFIFKIAIFQTFFLCLAILLTVVVTKHFIKIYFTEQARLQLEESTLLIRSHLPTNTHISRVSCGFLENKIRNRYTLIGLQGQVICDNYADPGTMENHSHRSEVKTALGHPSQQGISIRYSDTMKIDMLYLATLIPNLSPPLVIRVAISMEHLDQSLSLLNKSLFLLLLPAIIVILIITLVLAASLSSPFTRILGKITSIQVNKNGHTGEQLVEWGAIEAALDSANKDIKQYTTDLFIENKKIMTLIDAIAEGILAIDWQSQILFSNQQFQLIADLLHTSASSAALNDHHLVIRQMGLQRLIDPILAGQQPKITEIINHRPLDKFFEITVSALTEVRSQVIGAVISFTDITHHLHTEAKQKEFLANVAHEIKTPITAIKGFSKLLFEALNPPAQDRTHLFLTKIQSNSNRLIDLFDQILTLAAHQEKEPGRPETIMLAAYTQSIIDIFILKYKDKPMRVDLQLTTPSIYINKQMLDPMLMNLIDNAFKYGARDSLITVQWQRSKQTIQLVVNNEQSFIAGHHLPHIFDRFFQVDPSHSERGAGLGLSIVKNIASQCGVSISAQSKGSPKNNLPFFN